MKKKQNTEKQELSNEQPKDVEALSPLQLKMKELEDIGVKDARSLAMDEDEILLVNSTLPAYEQMHSLINRAMFEITINHHKHILAEKESKSEL